MREPAAIGFYPQTKSEIESMVKDLFAKVKVKKRDILGAVVPHAGYVYSGKTASHVFASLKKKYDTVVIFGPDHSGMAKAPAISTESWELPTGTIEPNKELADKLINTGLFVEDNFAHTYEHSIEVQLPFLQKALGKFKLVPIMIPSSHANLKSAQAIGEAVWEAVKKDSKVLLLASSDMTHFGAGYGFSPVEKGAPKWVEKTDKEIVDAIVGMNQKKVFELAQETTMCGYGPVLALMFAVDGVAKKSELLDYSTSYDVSKDKSAIVGYAAIVFE